MDQIELDTERKLVDRFLREVMQAHPKATYGEMMIRSALDQGAVERLLLSENVRKRRVMWVCRQCKSEWEGTQSRRSEIPVCAKCSSEDVMEDADRSMDLIDELTLRYLDG